MANVTPRYVMSATGLAFSAMSCESDWPEFLLSCGTVMPSVSLMDFSWLAQSAHSGGQL
jgi:hypothetical protein